MSSILVLHTTPRPIITLNRVIRIQRPTFRPRNVNIPFRHHTFTISTNPTRRLPTLNRNPVGVVTTQLNLRLRPIITTHHSSTISFRLLPIRVVTILRTTRHRNVPSNGVLPSTTHLSPTPLRLSNQPITQDLIMSFRRTLTTMQLLSIIRLRRRLPIHQVFQLLYTLTKGNVHLTKHVTKNRRRVNTTTTPRNTRLHRQAIPHIGNSLVQRSSSPNTRTRRLLFTIHRHVPRGLNLLQNLVQIMSRILPHHRRRTIRIMSPIRLRSTPRPTTKSTNTRHQGIPTTRVFTTTHLDLNTTMHLIRTTGNPRRNTTNHYHHATHSTRYIRLLADTATPNDKTNTSTTTERPIHSTSHYAKPTPQRYNQSHPRPRQYKHARYTSEIRRETPTPTMPYHQTTPPHSAQNQPLQQHVHQPHFSRATTNTTTRLLHETDNNESHPESYVPTTTPIHTPVPILPSLRGSFHF